MKYSITNFILLAIITLLSIANAQEKDLGKLSGKVTSAETGEEIIGANIIVENTKRGTTTDLEGNYALILPPGTYNLVVSALSYTKKKITDVEIKSGKELKLYIVLNSDAIKLEEVVVEAKANTSYEAMVLTKQRKAGAISDGISAEQIKRSVDATTGDALRRLVGVTLMDNKYIFIRGTTDRYNQATLNGTTAPSTDPDKKSFAFDMLPSGLLDNAIIVKSATPDIRGDFSGGLVQMSTLDFPSEFMLKISAGTSYNPNTTGKLFHSQQGGKKDWLGIDDGTRIRELPDNENTNLATFLKTTPNRWGFNKFNAPLSNSFSLASGTGYKFGVEDDDNSSELGVIGTLSYRTSYNHADYEQNNWIINRQSKGTKDNFSVLWAAMANLSYSYNGIHRISFKNNYTHSGNQEVINDTTIDNQTMRNNLIFLSTWMQRSVYSGQISGEHNFPGLFGLDVKWHIARTYGEQLIPDKQQTNYSYSLFTPTDPYVLDIGRRSWTELYDKNNSYSVDLTMPISRIKLKAGFLGEIKKTNYDVRSYEFSVDWRQWTPNTDRISQLPLDSIFAPENFDVGKIATRPASKPSDTYWGNSKLNAGYLLADVPFAVLRQSFRFLGGMRIEKYNADLTVPITTSRNETVFLDHLDYLPSMNLTYHITERTNLRLAFSKTLNRPEFREISRSDIYDWIKLVYEFGNPELDQATVLNYDVRFELFPSLNELFALSYFYKKIKDAIEQVAYFEPSRIISWRNATSDAYVSGWEIELRKNFGFITNYLSNLSISGNYSRIHSLVKFSDASINLSRSLQGQSSYVINSMITFQEPTLGTTISLLYNTFGERIIAVGSKYGQSFINLYEAPYDNLDLSITQTLGWKMELKFTIKNIIGKDKTILIDKVSDDKFIKAIHERISSRPTYGIQLSKSL